MGRGWIFSNPTRHGREQHRIVHCGNVDQGRRSHSGPAATQSTWRRSLEGPWPPLQEPSRSPWPQRRDLKAIRCRRHTASIIILIIAVCASNTTGQGKPTHSGNCTHHIYVLQYTDHVNLLTINHKFNDRWIQWSTFVSLSSINIMCLGSNRCNVQAWSKFQLWMNTVQWVNRRFDICYWNFLLSKYDCRSGSIKILFLRINLIERITIMIMWSSRLICSSQYK